MVAHVLLDRRFRPAAESLEVTEARVVVVVGIPKGKTLRCWIIVAEANNRLPVVVARVDSCLYAKLLSLVDHCLDKGLVGGKTARPCVSFDIVPIHVGLGTGVV